MFAPRKWQEECFARFQEKLAEGQTSFVFEACMGAGKSAMAAWIAKALLSEYGVDHVLTLVPWKSIQGDVEKGMLGAFGQLMGLDARSNFFTLKRRQVRQPRPKMEATVTTYHEVCNREAIDTLKMWIAEGFTFALICDEIHHTNEINGMWGAYIEQLKSLAKYSVFMSGTFFRSDKNPISCIPLEKIEGEDRPIKDYSYVYSQGVKDTVVREVTTRYINANVELYDRSRDRKFTLALSEVTGRELSEAKRQVLEPHGECIRYMIEAVHQDLMQTRSKFPDAACLFVCRPGGGDNFTRDGNEALEDRHVHQIARQIEALTGESPTVITHKDRDGIGKISAFRRSMVPYLVAVNMVSEGCDIPRLRSVAFCRYTTSQMLFRQIVGRALRMHTLEDGTAAQVYIPTFPKLVEFAEKLWREAEEGVAARRCPRCGGDWPCDCVCQTCGESPCVCREFLFEKREAVLLALDALPELDGGHMGNDTVREHYVQLAVRVKENCQTLLHANSVQMGLGFQVLEGIVRARRQLPPETRTTNPGAERDRLRRRIDRRVRQLAHQLYDKNYAQAYYQEIEVPFREKKKVMMNTWTVEQLRKVDDRLERRVLEVFRCG